MTVDKAKNSAKLIGFSPVISLGDINRVLFMEVKNLCNTSKAKAISYCLFPGGSSIRNKNN